MHTSNLYYNVPTMEAAEKSTLLQQIWIVSSLQNSGTEAIEGALKAAKNMPTAEMDMQVTKWSQCSILSMAEVLVHYP